MAKNTYILDACALIAFFNNEDGAETLHALFQEARLGHIEIIICAVNLCEVFYDCLRTRNAEVAHALLKDAEILPIKIFRNIGNDLIELAGKFKVEQKVSLADAFALGLTSRNRQYVGRRFCHRKAHSRLPFL